jgi:hypothetical protein
MLRVGEEKKGQRKKPRSGREIQPSQPLPLTQHQQWRGRCARAFDCYVPAADTAECDDAAAAGVA